jgi:hypothetical protein
MNLIKFIPPSVVRTAARTVLQTQKHSPVILFSAGIVGTVASTVLACKATLRVEEVLKKSVNQLEEINTVEHDAYSDQDRQQDKAVVYIRAGFALTKLYAPAIVVGSLAIGCLAGSHHIMSTRNAGLMAAYAALEKGFEEYRGRVTAEYGEEKDLQLRHGSQVVTIKGEDGKNTKVIRVAPGAPSVYARFFDQLNPMWDKNADYNKAFLRCQQNYANDMLVTRGHVFLNDVYDSLNIPRTSAGAMVGWVLRNDGIGDNYIDFGVFDGANERAREFVNGQESAILLDFNVDGVIYDKI